MRRKKQEQDAPASGDRRLTPVDVQQVEFRLAFRGYSERDVDAFLDRVTEDLSSYLEENERLRSAGALPPMAPASPGPSTQVEADDILRRAREEAASIVRRAEADAAAIRAAAGAAGSGDARAAVAPFLNREREFLQSLGLEEPAIHRVLRECYALLGLVSFFTCGEDEVRAWPIPAGTRAQDAAGTVHSDIARGFIRAEVNGYDDLVAANGSFAELRARGQLRLEGKDYIVRDGEVCHFRFNVAK